MDKDPVLSKSEIEKLNGEGHDLDESKIYTLRFLFNDKLNTAQDPAPFQVSGDILDELAEQSIGRPWIAPKYGEAWHLRSEDETVESMLAFQLDYAIGEIIDYVKYDSNNVWGIIEVFPEFKGAVQNELIAPHNSATFHVTERNGTLIKQATFLNLQTVPNGSYDTKLTGFKPICEKGMGACMEELRILGAAGKLTDFRKNKELFTNTLNRVVGAMSQEPEPQDASNADIVKSITDLQALVTSQNEAITGAIEANAAILKEVADATDGVDGSSIVETIGESDPEEGAVEGAAGKQITKPKPETQIPKEIANSPEFKKIQEELDEIKTAYQKERKDTADKERLRVATQIVSNRLKLKEIELETKEAAIQELYDLKDDDGNLKDLSLLVEDTDKRAGLIVGASGYVMPTLTGDGKGQTLTPSEVMALTEVPS